MRVKICGITNVEDALASAEAGADYLGFIFHPPSPRSIEPEEAGAIIKMIRERIKVPPTMVGVFVDEQVDEIAAVLDEFGLDLAQLSGEEVPFSVGDSRSPIYGRSYKALRPATAVEAEAEAEWYIPPFWQEASDKQNGTSPALSANLFPAKAIAPSLLIDSYHPTLRGGTGTAVEWAIVVNLFETTPGLMLAGGLNPENVSEAVRQLRPFAVDVASGVEARPGKKDAALVQSFINRAKNRL